MRMTPYPHLRSAGLQPRPAMTGSMPSGLPGGPHESLTPEVPAQRASASVSLEASLAQGGEEPPATQQAGARGPATASTSVPHTARPVQGQKRTPRGEEPLATQQAGAGGPATASTRVPRTARPAQGQKRTRAVAGRRAQASSQGGSVEDSTAQIRQGGAGGPAKASTRNPAPASVAEGRKPKVPSQFPRPAQKLQCGCSGNCCPPR